jgi:hypothetical protein
MKDLAVDRERRCQRERAVWSAEESRSGFQQTLTCERVKYDKVQHESQQTSASGDTNSRKWLQVAGVRTVIVAPRDQESPGSSPEGELAPAIAGSIFYMVSRPSVGLSPRLLVGSRSRDTAYKLTVSSS